MTAVLEGLLPVGATVVAGFGILGSSMMFEEQQRLGRLTVRQVEIADTDAVLEALARRRPGLDRDAEQPAARVSPTCRCSSRPPTRSARSSPSTRPSIRRWSLRPLEYGADIVMHSATKYLAGHSDLLMGVLVTRTTSSPNASGPAATSPARSPAAWSPTWPCAASGPSRCGWNGPRPTRWNWPAGSARTRRWRGCAIRACRPTRSTRARAACMTASARWSPSRSPGRPRRRGVCESVRLIAHATSLGGVESLIERRACMRWTPPAGVPPELLRFSVGIEHVEDLWADLARRWRLSLGHATTGLPRYCPRRRLTNGGAAGR